MPLTRLRRTQFVAVFLAAPSAPGCALVPPAGTQCQRISNEQIDELWPVAAHVSEDQALTIADEVAEFAIESIRRNRELLRRHPLVLQLQLSDYRRSVFKTFARNRPAMLVGYSLDYKRVSERMTTGGVPTKIDIIGGFPDDFVVDVYCDVGETRIYPDPYSDAEIGGARQWIP